MAQAFRGASLAQDTRFKDKDVLELKKRKYPASFEVAVDMKKIQFDVIKKWLTRRVTELNSGQEDDTLVLFIINMLVDDKVFSL
jgi:serine/arginine repetitive matrix protein 1